MTSAARAPRKKQTSAEENLSNLIIKGLQDKKAKQIRILDLRSLDGSVCDLFIVCSGDSSTQVEALARSVEESVSKESGEHPGHIEGRQQAIWMLLDYGNIVVHIFQPDAREFYGIERVWADARITEITE